MFVVEICLVAPSAPTAVIVTESALVVCQLRVTVSPLTILLLLALKTKDGAVGCATVTFACP